MYSPEWKIIDIIVYMILLTMAQLRASSSTLIPGNFIFSNMIRYFHVNLLSRHFMGVVEENDATFKICMSLQGNILDYILRIRKTHIRCV